MRLNHSVYLKGEMENRIKQHQMMIRIPESLFKHLAKLSQDSLANRSIASFVREALLEKYGGKRWGKLLEEEKETPNV